MIFFLAVTLSVNVRAYDKNVIKSVNFKLYYSEGGENVAKNLILFAEKNLGTIENFLGTRLVEKIDIFLLEKYENENNEILQRNGTILLTNTSIKIYYTGNILESYFQLKKQLSSILIYDMLFGNTIKERLKNNREVNIQDWFIKGLVLFVSQSNESETGFMTDYFEKRINLNFNLMSNSETEKIGFSIVKYLNDTFGTSKLKHILFYSKLSGNNDFAFKIVLNKSTDRIIKDWYKTQLKIYLTNNNMRLPNEPENLPSKLINADLIDLKFNADKQSFDLLIKTGHGIALYNYNFLNQKCKKVYQINEVYSKSNFAFVCQNQTYIISQSDGNSSKLYFVENSKINYKLKLDLSNINKIEFIPKGGITILAQKNFKTDLYYLSNLKSKSLTNITNGKYDIIDFVYGKNDEFFLNTITNEMYSIISASNSKVLYSSKISISELNLYNDSFLSFLSFDGGINSGLIVNIYDSSKFYKVTNYNRSIKIYDYNYEMKKVAEVINYDKKNYIVLSDVSTQEFFYLKKNLLTQINDTFKKAETIIDSTESKIYFITGFEYRKDKISIVESKNYTNQKLQLQLKQYKIDKTEFKPLLMKIAYTNKIFNTPLFPYFFPVDQGLYNGANIIFGCSIVDIYNKYKFEGNIREPLRSKGTDIDFTVSKNKKNAYSAIKYFENNYQREFYNQPDKYKTIQIEYMNFIKIDYKTDNFFKAGIRSDINYKTSVSEENIIKSNKKLYMPFLYNNFNFKLYEVSKLNYKQQLNFGIEASVFKPVNKTGLNNTFKLKISHKQLLYRVFTIKTDFIINTSPSKLKTVYLLGGQSNWVKPVLSFSNNHDSLNTILYSSTEDFEGFPLNYIAGNSYSICKLKFILPVNPILSYYSFNQNIFKFLTLKAILNTGTAWFGNNPFSITNPENRTVTETGSMTIVNYTYKNPLLWSWCTGLNTVLLGYNIGIDYSKGYNERGYIDKFICFTIGKEI
ncbi:MAG: hypothetical protein IT243_00385 [Bacteroidia bacterium]|nr:hypothetical protein [Bacteroidia bacterium]